jgi:hypothetical protein
MVSLPGLGAAACHGAFTCRSKINYHFFPFLTDNSFLRYYKPPFKKLASVVI